LFTPLGLLATLFPLATVEPDKFKSIVNEEDTDETENDET
jgi:hypothetical protein